MIPELFKSDLKRKHVAFLIMALLLSLSFFLPQFASNTGNTAPSLGPKEVDEAKKEKALKAYGKLPIYFIPNKGQINSKVKYYAAGAGYSFFLTKDGVTYSFVREKGAKSKALGSLDKEKGLGPQNEQIKQEGYALKIQFAGANPATKIEGQNKKSAKINYFIGSDKSDWKTDISTFGQATYSNLYPGIDLTYKGKGGKLKYEFIVGPKADPGKIKLLYKGAKSLKTDRTGNLLIGTHWGSLKDEKPVVYQMVGKNKIEVKARFNVNQNAVGFTLGEYDKNLPLVIDPGLVYSTFLGVWDSSLGRAITIDASGNAYVTGWTFSSFFPTTAGAYDTSFNGYADAFVTQLNPSGSTIVFSTFLGGSGGDGFDGGYGIALDGTRDVYVTGNTRSLDFPTTAGAYDTTLDGGKDAFVAKLNSDGSALVYATFLGGGTYDEEVGDIALDAAGNAYMTGSTDSTNFPTTAGAYDTTLDGGKDAFVAKLNADGSAIVYSTFLGGSSWDYGYDLALDTSGNALIAGSTGSSNFPTTASAYDTSLGGYTDAFVTKLDSEGGSLVYSTFLGGTSGERGSGIAVDTFGNSYLIGETYSSDFPTTAGAYDTSYNSGDNDAFLTKLNSSGSDLVYSTFLGGSGQEYVWQYYGTSIAVDAPGNAYVTGGTDSSNFPTTAGAHDITKGGGMDAFVSKLNSSGSDLVYSTFLGGSADENGSGIAVDPSGNAYTTGVTHSSDFPTTPGAYNTTRSGSLWYEAFVTKLDFIPDTSPPATTFATDPIDPNGLNGWFKTTPSITLTRDEPGTTHYSWTSSTGPWTTYSTPFNAPEGQNTLYYYSVDIAGNAETVKSQLFKVDTGLPTNPTVSSPSHTTGIPSKDNTIDINWSGATDTVSGVNSFLVDWMVTSQTTGSFQTKWGGYGSGDGQFNWPLGIAVDQSGNVYVADTSNHRIQKFDSNGNFLTKFGSYGSGNGQFNSPEGIAVDQSGNVYVADRNNNRIQKFDSSGSFITKWGSSGSSDGQFNLPTGIAVDQSVNVYVAEGWNHRIQKFDSNGNFLTKFGSYGSGNGQFNLPEGIAVDQSGNVYVADRNNNRIQKFDSLGNFLATWGSHGTSDGQFNWPFGIVADQSENVYVADYNNNRIQKFDSSGNFLTKWGSVGNGDGQFSQPSGLTLDRYGNVYVADTTNYRIQKFSAPLYSEYLSSSVGSTTSPLLSDGPWYLNLSTKDNAGNWTAAVQLGPFVIDTMPSTTTLETSPPVPDGTNGWFKTTPSIILTRDEPGTTYYSWISSTGPWTTYSAPFSAPEGEESTLYYYSVDTAGNAETVKSQLFKVDTQPPANFLQNLPGSETVNRPYPYFSWSASADTASGLAKYQLYIDGSLSRDYIVNWTAAVPSTALANGSHTWFVRAWDDAGNYQDTGSRVVTVTSGPGRIAFESSRDGNPEIYVMNADGSDQRRLTNNGAYDMTPAFSPDGSKIVFLSGRDGGGIYVMNTDGSDVTRVGTVRGGAPSFSPDGSKIAFGLGVGGNLDVYTMNIDGTNVTRLTNDPAWEGFPVFSADGSKIAYMRGEIYIMNANGSGQTPLTLGDGTAQWPAFSPDGGKIAFDSQRGGTQQIYVMNPDGTNPTNLSNNVFFDYDPSFAPDNNRVAFGSDRSGNHEIYAMKSDGTEQVNLTNNLAYDSRPSWGPAAPDTSPPSTSLATAPSLADGDNGWFKTTPSITLTRDEPGTTYYSWTSSTGPWTTYSTPFNAPEGENTLYYYSVDTAGNSEAVKSQLFKVDTQPPASFTQDLPADGATVNKPYPYFSWYTSSDLTSGMAKYQLYVDGFLARDNITDWTAAVPSAALSNGPHTWFVRAWDAAGNYTDSATRSFTVDAGAGKIVFGDAWGEIYTMNFDGSNVTRLTNNSVPDNEPDWSPDGSKIAFYSYRDYNYDIYAMNADGTNQIRLTTDASLDEGPDFSPDGSKIAFFSARDGNEEIYIMNVDGTNQTRLTYDPAPDHHPVFSPDGSKIAFNSGGDIFVINTDGTGRTNLTNNPGTNLMGAFSPDGSKIVFTSTPAPSYAANDYEIYVMNADGTNRSRLTNNSAQDDSGVFSPDGVRIAFISNRDANYEIYAMNTDGTGQINLTNNPASDSSPDWGPSAPLPNVTLTPNSGPAFPQDFAVLMNVSGFPPNTFLSFELLRSNGTRVFLGGQTTDSSGGFAGYVGIQQPADTYTMHVFVDTNLDGQVDPGGAEASAILQVYATDTTPPVTSLSSSPASPDGSNGWFKTTPSITLSRNEPGTTYYKWEYESGWTTYSVPFNAPQGQHTLYYYSKDSAGNVELVKTAAFKVDSQAPTAPSNVSAIPMSSSQIELSWNASTDASSGVARSKIYNGDTDAELATTTGTSYSFASLNPDTAYNYYVKAEDKAGNISGPSSVAQATTYKAPVTTQPPPEGPAPVTVDLGNNLTVDFEQVSGSGETSITVSETAPGPDPGGFSFLDYYWDINTTATFTGKIKVTFPYDETQIQGAEENLRLFHWENGAWEDVTVLPVDTVNNLITGEVDSLSPFALGMPSGAPPSVPTGLNTYWLAFLGLLAMVTGFWVMKTKVLRLREKK